MIPVLIISGPTATGKTVLALHLANKFSGDLISADSRQVYKGLDIVTGKDIPEGFIFQHDSYTNGTIRIYGYDLVTPDQEWNAALFQRYAQLTITQIAKRNRLPIIVGGTGLYLRSLTNKYSFPPTNPVLRMELEKLSLPELQHKLAAISSTTYSQLNHSDVNNPRRLIRHLEILTSKANTNYSLPDYHILHLHLTTSLGYIQPKIRARVISRLSANPEPELKYLRSFGITKVNPAFTSTGFKQLELYYQKRITKAELINLWTTAERQYAKRQLTWFAKQDNLIKINLPVDETSIAATVELWYSQLNYGKK